MSGALRFAIRTQIKYSYDAQSNSIWMAMQTEGSETTTVMQVPITPELLAAAREYKAQQAASQQEGAKDGDDGLTG